MRWIKGWPKSIDEKNKIGKEEEVAGATSVAIGMTLKNVLQTHKRIQNSIDSIDSIDSIGSIGSIGNNRPKYWNARLFYYLLRRIFHLPFYRLNRSVRWKYYFIRDTLGSSMVAWTVKSLIVYLILDIKKDVEMMFVVVIVIESVCPRDWNTNFEVIFQP